MKHLSVAIAIAIASLGLVSSRAQEAGQAPPAPSQPPSAEQPAPPADENEPRTLEEIFIPSEEIAADEEVTFPINI